jgi:hypothetical protein
LRDEMPGLFLNPTRIEIRVTVLNASLLQFRYENLLCININANKTYSPQIT